MELRPRDIILLWLMPIYSYLDTKRLPKIDSQGDDNSIEMVVPSTKDFKVQKALDVLPRLNTILEKVINSDIEVAVQGAQKQTATKFQKVKGMRWNCSNGDKRQLIIDTKDRKGLTLSIPPGQVRMVFRLIKAESSFNPKISACSDVKPDDRNLADSRLEEVSDSSSYSTRSSFLGTVEQPVAIDLVRVLVPSTVVKGAKPADLPDLRPIMQNLKNLDVKISIGLKNKRGPHGRGYEIKSLQTMEWKLTPDNQNFPRQLIVTPKDEQALEIEITGLATYITFRSPQTPNIEAKKESPPQQLIDRNPILTNLARSRKRKLESNQELVLQANSARDFVVKLNEMLRALPQNCTLKIEELGLFNLNYDERICIQGLDDPKILIERKGSRYPIEPEFGKKYNCTVVLS